MEPITVLVVDTNPAFLRFVVQFLEEQHGATIHVAGAAFRQADALVFAAATSPQVVLIGLSGPNPPALALIAEIRRVLPPAAIVVMSQLGAAGYAQAALAAGADAFVDKDRLRADLAPAICQAVCSSSAAQAAP